MHESFCFPETICASLIFTSCEKEPLPSDDSANLKFSIEMLDPEDITDTSATLVVKINPVGKSFYIYFEYLMEEESILMDMVSCSGDQEIIIKCPYNKFTPNTEYQVRARAREMKNNQFVNNGISATSNIKTFKTSNIPIISIVQSKATYDEINLKLNLIPGEPDVKVLVEYIVNGQVYTKGGESYCGDDPLEICYKLDGLSKDTKYPVKIKAIGKTEVLIDTTLVSAAVQDYDGNYYRTVTIGNQVWLMDNFCGTHFANGDSILHLPNPNEWEATSTPAYTYYNNDADLGAIYGGMYNHYVARDTRGLIEGYHVPNREEWKILAETLGGFLEAAIEMKDNSGAYWPPSPYYLATNSSGFTALPSGRVQDGGYIGLGHIATFWTSEKEDQFNLAFIAYILYNRNELYANNFANHYYTGFSIRLVKD